MHNKLHTCICLSLEIYKKLSQRFFVYRSCLACQPGKLDSALKPFSIGNFSLYLGGHWALEIHLFSTFPFPLFYIQHHPFYFFSKKFCFYLLTFPFCWFGVRWVERSEKKSLRLLYTYIHNIPSQQSFTKEKERNSIHSFFKLSFPSLFSLQHHSEFFF